ncbi:replicative DNA helicase [Candidatus Gracilibacteria bacterium]|nr:replicative DNA helicase [Candidatus Gracilibacteria bacterium]
MIQIDDINLPPHNIEAEKGVLSGVLIDNDVLWIYDGDGLLFQDFYQKEHSLIYKAIQELWNQRKTIDIVTLTDQLNKNGDTETIGGIDYLYELSNFLISTSSCGEYSKIVKDKSTLRNILKVSQKIIGDVYQQKDTVGILDDIEKKIFELTQQKIGDSMMKISDILKQRIENYMEIVDNPEKAQERKVMSGYTGIDNYITGFKPGELIIVAARPSMGKTSFAINILTNVALKQNKSVAMLSLEMGSESIVDRIIAEVSRVPMYKITKGNLDEEDFSNIGEAIEKLGETKIYIDDKGAYSVPQLKSKLRKLKIEKGALDIVIIDYLQLMHGTNFPGNRVQEISEISRGLKELARELEVPIIALSQLSRAVEQRVDKKPQLSDLRESGAIEQDADAVIMLHREDYYDPDTDKKGSTDICIRKNRNGAVGEVELHFEKEIMKFTEKAVKAGDGTY